ncbi:MAG: sigma-70 family RNA polymerase sigma factor [Bacteroidota bacterium]
MEYTEPQLIESWALGNRDAAESIIRQYYPYAYALCLGYCKGNQDMANSAVQSFFTRLTQFLPKVYKGNRSKFEFIQNNFQAYLQGGLRNNAKEQIRIQTKQNNRITPISGIPALLLNSKSSSNNFERKNALEYILSFLPNSQQSVYRFYLEGYSYEEIAKQTGLNKAQVRGRIERSTKALKAHKALIQQLLTQ